MLVSCITWAIYDHLRAVLHGGEVRAYRKLKNRKRLSFFGFEVPHANHVFLAAAIYITIPNEALHKTCYINGMGAFGRKESPKQLNRF
jgi:hypothetical protein